jgi:hypothetical protein
MPRSTLAVLSPEPNDDDKTRSILLNAQRLLAKGDRAQAVQCLKQGAEAALACDDDRRALKLAAAAAELRATGELESARAEPASAVMAVGARASSQGPAAPYRGDPPPLPSASNKTPAGDAETIDVDTGWLEPAGGDASDRDDLAGSVGRKASLGEAVRVWVGPSGDLLLYTPGTRPMRGYIEALLVTHAATSGLAKRVRGR